MQDTIQKEEFSRAFVQAVGSAAGFSVTRPSVDEGIDVQISASNRQGYACSPKIELQLKCTSRDVVHNDYVRFPLDVETYCDLREPSVIPRMLVVVVVPSEAGDWVDVAESELTLRHCAYWAQLKDQPDTSNQRTITVRIPRTQQFTPEFLRNEMEKLSKAQLR